MGRGDGLPGPSAMTHATAMHLLFVARRGMESVFLSAMWLIRLLVLGLVYATGRNGVHELDIGLALARDWQFHNWRCQPGRPTDLSVHRASLDSTVSVAVRRGYQCDRVVARSFTRGQRPPSVHRSRSRDEGGGAVQVGGIQHRRTALLSR